MSCFKQLFQTPFCKFKIVRHIDVLKTERVVADLYTPLAAAVGPEQKAEAVAQHKGQTAKWMKRLRPGSQKQLENKKAKMHRTKRLSS